MHTAVGIVTKLKAGLYGVQIPADGKEFYSLQNVQSGSEDQPTQWVPGFFPGGKATGV